MSKPTHNINFHFEATNVNGETKRFQCSKPVALDEWETPREAAIWAYFNDTREAHQAEGWHLTAPRSIQVWSVRPLSDAGF